MKRLFGMAREELVSESPLRILFSKSFSKILGKQEALSEARSDEEKAQLGRIVEDWGKMEEMHFDGVKKLIDSVLDSFEESDALMAFECMQALGTTILLQSNGKGGRAVRLKNGFQAIRKTDLDKFGMPTHTGDSISADLKVCAEYHDGCGWCFMGKLQSSTHMFSQIPSLKPPPPTILMGANFVGINALMSVVNVMDHLLHPKMKAAFNCHPNVLALNLFLFRAVEQADMLPALMPQGKLCEANRNIMSHIEFTTWEEMSKYFSEVSFDYFDPIEENLKELCDKTKVEAGKVGVKLSLELLNKLAKDENQAIETLNKLEEQIKEAGGKVQTLVLEWGGAITFNKDGYANCCWKNNKLLDTARTASLCRLIWDKIEHLCEMGICMQSGYPSTLEEGKHTPISTGRVVTGAWVAGLARTHSHADSFAQGVGDCALSLEIAQRVLEIHGDNCPGSYFQPIINLVPSMLMEFQDFEKDDIITFPDMIFSEMKNRKRARVTNAGDANTLISENRICPFRDARFAVIGVKRSLPHAAV